MNHLAANTLSVLILFIAHSTIMQGSSHAFDEPSSSVVVVVGELQLQPIGISEYRVGVEFVEGNNTGRRRLAPFQLCLVCRCCAAAADPTSCANMPCCFGIDCQLPNKPYGVCAFVPKTCNCNSCAV